MDFPTSIIPSVEAIAKALKYTQETLRSAHPEPTLDEDGNEPDTEFRVQLVDGNVHYHSGDPGFDQDHRGVWANNWVYHSDTEAQLRSRAVDVRYDLEEAWCEAFRTEIFQLPDEEYWSIRVEIPHLCKKAKLRLDFPAEEMTRTFLEGWAGDPENLAEVFADEHLFESLYTLEN